MADQEQPGLWAEIKALAADDLAFYRQLWDDNRGRTKTRHFIRNATETELLEMLNTLLEGASSKAVRNSTKKTEKLFKILISEFVPRSLELNSVTCLQLIRDVTVTMLVKPKLFFREFEIPVNNYTTAVVRDFLRPLEDTLERLGHPVHSDETYEKRWPHKIVDLENGGYYPSSRRLFQ